MHISFQNKYVRSLCENHEIAKKALGETVAERLKTRLADMIAITYLSDLLVGNLRKIENNSLTYIIDLCDYFVLHFAVSHVKTPLTEEGNVDNTKVFRIKILEIKEQK